MTLESPATMADSRSASSPAGSFWPARVEAYRDAFPGALIAYAVKANPDPRLLRRLADADAGAEVVNAVELALVHRAGFRGAGIVMNGVGKSDADHAAAIEAGALLVAESLSELDQILAQPRARDWRLGLRLNPGLAAETHRHLATGAADSKFGIGWTDLDTAIDRCRAAGRPIESIGAHIGSAIADVTAYSQLAERLAGAAGRAGASRIDLGGGAGTDLEPAALADAIRPHLPDAARTIIEPGRSLVAAVLDLNHRIHADFAYEPGATSVATPIAEVLRDRRGVCQDFTHLAIACLRSLGLAARYVSGYVVNRRGTRSETMVGADASHAWLAVYVPGSGWLDLDPTNDTVPNDQHVTVAWGRDYGDVPPLKGVIYTEGSKNELTVEVDVVAV